MCVGGWHERNSTVLVPRACAVRAVGERNARCKSILQHDARMQAIATKHQHTVTAALTVYFVFLGFAFYITIIRNTG